MPKIVKPLSDVEIKKARIKEKDYYLYDGEGLCLLVKKTGVKLWRFNFTFNKKRNTISFGKYPYITLKDAREKRNEAKIKIINGISPSVTRDIVNDGISFKLVSEQWLNVMKGEWSSSNYNRIKSNLENNAYPFIGEKNIKDITRKEILNFIEIMQDRGAIEYASRLLNNIGRIYKYAVTNEYVEHNIIVDIDKNNAIKKRKKEHLPAITNKKDLKNLIVDIKEINQVFNIDVRICYALLFALYNPLRSFNIRSLEWNEIDFENNIIEISAEKMKTSVDFVLPFSKQTKSILNILKEYRTKSKYVFYSSVSSSKFISINVLNNCLYKLGYKNIHTMHGFRSTFSTLTHENIRFHGKHSDIIEACLAHTERNLVKKAYNRESKYKYIDEKRELIQWWADWLDDL